MSASGRAKDMYAAIGEMVATWNGLEWDIAELFEELCSDRMVAHVVSAQLFWTDFAVRTRPQPSILRIKAYYCTLQVPVRSVRMELVRLR